MSNAPASNATSWSVTSQFQTTKLGPNNQPQTGYDVTFITGKGHTGTVFLTLAQYGNTDTAKGIIGDAANQVDTVGSLTSDS